MALIVILLSIKGSFSSDILPSARSYLWALYQRDCRIKALDLLALNSLSMCFKAA